MKALFTTAVWGKAYLDRFLKYSLPTQLSDGNLGVFDKHSLYLLVTDRSDLAQVKSAPAFRELSRLISTECVAREAIAGSRSGNKYAKLTACQNYALERSVDFDVVFFGYGDALWADGSYRAAADRLMEGYDVVFSFGFPVASDRFAAIVHNAQDETDEAVVLAPRIFAQHVYQHLHPMARANNWQADPMSRCPSYVMWDIPGHGMLLRSFHLHPVAVRVRHDEPSFFVPFRSTLDEEFVARLYRTYPRAYVCTNSDEMGVCSLAEVTGESYECRARRPRSAGALAEFAEAHAGLMHRELFSYSIRLVTAEGCEDLWRTAEEAASRLAADVERRLATPDCLLALEAPAAYDARWRRQAMFGHMSPEAARLRRQLLGLSRSTETMSRAMRWAGQRLISVMHALYLTRAARVVLLPMLNLRQRRWCYEFMSNLGIDVPLINSAQKASSGFRWSNMWRWLRSLIRAHA